MFNNMRYQFAAMCFLAIIMAFYGKSKKLPLLSTRVFSAMLITVCVNLIFDMITVYTVYNVRWMPPPLNRFCHQVFIGSLDMTAFLFFLYVRTLALKQKRLTRSRLLLSSVPLIIAFFMILFGQLHYFNNGKYAYSYGPMANTVYLSVALYIGIIVFYTYKYKETISVKARVCITGGLGIWISATFIQLFNPEQLLSGLSEALMVFLIYLSFENPREHYEAEADAFNAGAMNEVLDEGIESGKTFYVCIIVMRDLHVLQSRFGQAVASSALSRVSQYASECLDTMIFHPFYNVLAAVISPHSHLHCGDLNGILSDFKKVWDIDDIEMDLELRCGVLEVPKFAGTLDDINNSMYYFSKRCGEVPANTLAIIDDKLLNARRRYSAILQLLRQAVDGDGFDVFYQPIFAPASGRYASAEALVRLKDTGDLGFISPEEFVPIAEHEGLIKAMGATVFDKVCAFYTQNKLDELGIEYIEVNLSVMQCMDASLTSTLRALMEKYSLSPGRINLELTETVAADKNTMVRQNVAALQELGCSFSMDDFGSGYSNLSQIAETSFALIKLDKSLVWQYFDPEPSKGRIILPNIVRMINELGISIVAEGVETQEQSETLAKMGVAYLQGYFYSRPVPAEKALGIMLEANSRQQLVQA